MKIRAASFIAAILALTTTVTAARADVLTSKTAGVSIEKPAGWKSQAQGDVMLMLADPAEEVGLLFLVVDESDVKKAVGSLEQQINKLGKDVKWSKPSAVTINGMPGIAFEGSAKIDGKPVSTGAILLATPAKKVVIVLGMIKAGREGAHLPTLKAMFQSLKPL